MYTNKGAIQNYLMIDIDSSFDTQVTTWITAVQNYINNYTGKKDGFESAAETRYFDGNDKREIDVDDFTSLTSVQIIEANGDDVEYTLSEGQDNDYIIYPYNDTPQYRLILTANSQVGAWYGGKKRIKITGVWGHSTSVPKDIELAATMLVSGIIKKGLTGGEIQSESLGDYSVTFASMDVVAENMGVMEILDRYKVYELI